MAGRVERTKGLRVNARVPAAGGDPGARQQAKDAARPPTYRPLSMEVLDKESAALPLLVSTALLRVALTPLAHALATYHIHHIAVRPTKPRGRVRLCTT